MSTFLNANFFGLACLTAAFLFCAVAPTLAELAEEGPIKIASIVPYEDETEIANNIVEECTQLGEKLGRFVGEFATKYDVPTEVVDQVDPTGGGRALVVEITAAHSGGGAFIGHRKSMTARAELFVDGESKGSQVFTRDSGGGAFGGYKGSCSVLGRCTKALGKDIAKWLRDLD